MEEEEDDFDEEEMNVENIDRTASDIPRAIISSRAQS